MTDRLRTVVATLVGGPRDGELRVVPAGWRAIIYVELAAVRAEWRAPGADEAITPVDVTEHYYDRTDDWLRDGSVVFEHRSRAALPDGRAR